jgi:hypothetical protein
VTADRLILVRSAATGATRRAAMTAVTAGLRAWLDDPDPDGRLRALVAGFLARAHDRPDTTVAVTHAAWLRTAVLEALRAPPAAFWRVDVAPASLPSCTAASTERPGYDQPAGGARDSSCGQPGAPRVGTGAQPAAHRVRAGRRPGAPPGPGRRRTGNPPGPSL